MRVQSTFYAYLTLLAICVLPHPVASEEFSCQGSLAFVTGATARVGSMVTRRLIEQGFCVRAFSRNATKAKEQLGDLLDNPLVEVAVGNLGDGISVARAFQPRDTTHNAVVSHIVFAAGGEEADFSAVNNRGVAECAKEAVKAGAKSMVVISAAWVTKPFSLASILFNNLYDNLPMASHLEGEDELRKAAIASDNFSYAILRAGRLVPDNEYPAHAPKGLLYQQGDSFAFFGPAGQPGMCNTQLADAVMTALRAPGGKFTVEVTGGTVDQHDASVYKTFVQDGSVAVSSDQIRECHYTGAQKLKVMTIISAGLFILFFAYFGFLRGILVFLFGLALQITYWSSMLSDISVFDCTRQSRGTQEL